MFKETLVMSGYIDGNVILDSDIEFSGLGIGFFSCRDVIVTETGVVNGNLKCRNAVVFGTVVGNTTASGNVSLRKNAQISGSLSCAEVEVEEGAVLNCRIQCNKNSDSPGNLLKELVNTRQKTKTYITERLVD